MVDHNLDEDIAIDFHSHNNYQLSFAFAQEIIRLSNGKRDILIDGTLHGMGKVAGNLNTELIVDYLVRKRNFDYNFDAILDEFDQEFNAIVSNIDNGLVVSSISEYTYCYNPNADSVDRRIFLEQLVLSNGITNGFLLNELL